MNKLKVLKVLMVALVAFATLGCGSSSSNDFVGVNPNDPSETGGLLFQFHRGSVAAQSLLPFDVNTDLQGNVPAGTDHIGFIFYESAYAGEWTSWSEQTFPFGAQDDLSVNIQGVPTSVHFAVAIAYNVDGLPFAAIYSPEFNVIAGYNDLPIPLNGDENAKDLTLQSLTAHNVTMDMTGTATANISISALYSNDRTSVTVPLPYGYYNTVDVVDSAVATYADGVFTAVAAGNTTYSVTYGPVTSSDATITVTDNTPYITGFANEDVHIAANTTVTLSFSTTDEDTTVNYADLPAGYTVKVTKVGVIDEFPVGADGKVTFTTPNLYTATLSKGGTEVDSIKIRVYGSIWFGNASPVLVDLAAVNKTVVLTFKDANGNVDPTGIINVNGDIVDSNGNLVLGSGPGKAEWTSYNSTSVTVSFANVPVGKYYIGFWSGSSDNFYDSLVVTVVDTSAP